LISGASARTVTFLGRPCAGVLVWVLEADAGAREGEILMGSVVRGLWVLVLVIVLAERCVVMLTLLVLGTMLVEEPVLVPETSVVSNDIVVSMINAVKS
jgi:hypothetical protein